MLETLSRCWWTLAIRGAPADLAVVILVAVYASVFGLALVAFGLRLCRGRRPVETAISTGADRAAGPHVGGPAARTLLQLDR